MAGELSPSSNLRYLLRAQNTQVRDTFFVAGVPDTTPGAAGESSRYPEPAQVDKLQVLVGLIS